MLISVLKSKNHPILIAVTGPIHSGKTLFCSYLKKNIEAEVINADQIVSSLYEKGNLGYLKIKNRFGMAFFLPDGTVNKLKLANFIFSSKKRRICLEKMIHPLVFAQIIKRIIASRKKIVLLESVIFPADFLRECDLVIEIKADFAAVIKRNRNHYAKWLLRRIYNAYVSPERIDLQFKNNSTIFRSIT